MKQNRGRRQAARGSASLPETKWVVRFETEGLEPRDVRMIEELIAGNLGIARLLFDATPRGGDVGKQIAESVRDALAADFPSTKFRIEPDD